ncbi:hypothetical protein OJ927_10540, partial [Streptococcus anginosus]|nr:hypothetical protein [Streptococcus anginosus]
AINKMTGHSQKAKDPLKSVASAMQELGKHKKEIVAVGKAFALYFVANKTVKGVTSLTKGIVGLAGNVWDATKKASDLARGFKNFSSAKDTFVASMTAIKAAIATNPVGAVLVGVTALVAGFALLYKHNKKFRDFCNGIASSVKKAFKGIVNFFKNDWKELLLLIVNPLAGGFALLYKHNKKFKGFCDGLVKAVKNGIAKVGKFLGDAGKAVVNFGKTVGKVLIFANPFVLGFALMYKHSKPFRKFIKGLVNGAKSLYKNFKKFFGSTGKFIGKTFDGIKKGISKKYNQVAKSIGNTSKKIGRAWSKHWNGAKDFLGSTWDKMNKASEKKFGKDLKGTLFDNLANIGKKFQETWDGIKKGFDDLWDGLKNLARDGINALIDIPNAGIDGINGLIHDFGGPKQTIGKIPHVKKFASGT